MKSINWKMKLTKVKKLMTLFVTAILILSVLTVAAGSLAAAGTETTSDNELTAGSDPIKNEDTGKTFSTIQAAIDDTDTDAGDTIIVNSGTYVENVVVDKEITLKGNNTGDGAPVIDGNQESDTVNITADNVGVTGFNITNSTYDRDGIYIYANDNSNIYNNTIIDNGDGVYLNSSSNNNVTNNNITGNNYAGVELVESSDDNIITNNKITDNNNYGLNGVHLSSSSNNTITKNNITRNEYDGVYIKDSSNNNTIQDNKITNNDDGVYITDSSNNNTIQDNKITNNDDGVYLHSSSDNNTIKSNNITDNSYGGVHLYSSSNNNTIQDNKITGSDENGVELHDSSNNTVQNNIIEKNKLIGLHLSNTLNVNIWGNEISNGLVVDEAFDLDVVNNNVNGDPLIYHEDNDTIEISEVNAGQIVLNNCTDFTITNQEITNIGMGIELHHTNQTTITNTKLTNNLYGIGVMTSNNNTIKKTNISQNPGVGVLLMGSNDNTFFLNDLNNTQNVQSDSDNTWVSPEPITYTYDGETYTSRVGNYWSDYAGTDSDNDGLYDGNKTIKSENNNDTRPLVNTIDNYINTVNEFAGGDGSVESPYQIENWYHLNNTRKYLGANFTLIADLNETTEGYDEVTNASANGGKGFKPISDPNDFGGLKGTFDGQGYTISDLIIDRPSEDYIGLFEWVAPYGDGAVRNLTIDNVDITGNDYVGAVAGGHGEAYATIENVSVGGTITGNQYVGGLVGLNQGQIENCSTDVSVYGNRSVGGFVGYNGGAIIYSTASGTVTVKDGATDPMNFGGLVGKSYRGAVGYSSATGDVDADSATNVGGLIGNNINDLVDNSYATGNVNGSSNVGGLVGNNTGSNALVNNSYAVGEITTTGDKVGGLVGVNESGATVKNSYWNTETTGQDTSAGNAEGLTTAEMKNKSTFAGWDFEKIWNIMEPDSGFYSYPYLQNNKQDQVPGKEAVSLESVEITPSADQTITAGETIDFSAIAYDQYDNQVYADDTNFTWQNTDDTGLFDKTTAGQYDVKATMDSIDSAVITVTVESASVNTVEITPSSDQTIKAGETIDFNASAEDQYGNLITETDSDFTWQNTDNTGLFDKTTAGQYDVKATMNNVDSTVITVTVERTEYDLTINIAGEGSTDPAEGSHTYDESEDVTITATPAEGWYFSNWTGDYDGTSEEISITMDSDKEITANFEEEVSFQVDITDYDQKVVEGEEVTVEYTVENNGEIESTQDIVLMIDGENTTVKEDLTLAPGESSTEEYTWIPDDPGEYSVGLPGDDPDDLVQVTVDTEYQVDVTDLEGSVEEGEEVTVEYTVENPGETESTQDIVLLINGEEVIVEEGVTLKPGETYSGEYTWTPENVGDIEVGVPGDDSGDFNQVTVEKGSQSDNLWIVILLLVSGFAAMLWLNKDKIRPKGSVDEKEDLTELQKKESESEEEELTEE